MARGGTAYGADGTITIGTSVDMYGMNTGLRKIQKSINKLKLSIGAALGIGTLGFGALGKAAVDAASDLQEVQNIVDVAFEDMSYMIENFADTAIENFGMSELAAKQTAGSFMAMGKALGIEKEEAAKMAIRLTALTGDMSSFYNISQDYARVAMSAVYTGETETLKRYGIVLTEANLQEYALTQGIQTKVKAMDASTKAMLRYQYVLQATQDITGDFIRTQDTWANQVRVLQQRWNQLLITIGSGLITVFTPFVKSLNVILQAVIQFANTVGEILSRLFGIQWQDMSAEMSSLADSNEDVASSAEDAADEEEGLGTSTDQAAKKAKKALAPWDELTDLFKATASSAGGASGALSDIEIGDLIGGKKLDEGGWGDLLGIDTLFGLGRWLSQKLTDMLKNIPWEKIYAAAKQFGHGLADYLNGLITPELFYQVGRTIANALNTAIYAALAFGERFNWINFGRSIAAGINGFFENFDFRAFAETINTWAKGLLDTIIKALTDVDWELIGTKIGEFLRDLDFLAIFKKVFQVIGKAIEAAFDVITNMSATAPLETFLLSLFALGKFFSGSMFKKLSKGFGLIIDFFRALGSGPLQAAALANITRTAPALRGLVNIISALQLGFGNIAGATGFFDGIVRFGQGIGGALMPLEKAVGGIVTGVLEFITVFNSIKNIVTYIDKGTTSLDKMATAIGTLVAALGIAAASFSILFGFPAGLIITGVVAATAAIGGLVSAMNEIHAEVLENAFASFVNSVEGASHSLDDYMIVFDNMTENITSGLAQVNQSFTNLETSRQEVRNTVDVIGTISLAMTTERQLTKEQINLLGQAFGGLTSQLSEYVNSYYDTIIMQTKADYEYVKSIQGDSEALKEEYANRIQSLYEAKIAAQADAEVVGQQATDAYNNYIDVLNNTESTEQDIINAQNALHDASLQIIESSMEMSHQTSEMDTTLQNAKKSFDDLEGSLNLADYGIKNTDDAAAAISGTLDEMSGVYTKAKDTIETELDNINNSLKTATGTAKTELEAQKTTAESRLGELNKAYSDGLKGIQEDLVKMVPGIAEKVEQEWESKDFLYKKFYPKDAEIKNQTNEFIEKMYGDEEGGLNKSLSEAWSKLGEGVAPDAEAASKEVLESFFKPIQETESMWPTAELKDNWKSLSSDMMSGAIEGIDEKASDFVDKVNQPYKDAIEAVRTTNDSHSPSVVYHDLSVDMMDGAISGLDEKGSEFVDKVKDIYKQAVDVANNTNTNDALSGFKTLIDTISAGIESFSGKLKTTITTFPQLLQTQIIEFARYQISLAITDLLSSLTLLDTNIRTLLTNLAQWLDATFLLNIKTSFTTLNTTMELVISVKFKQIWEKATDAVKQMFEALAGAIVEVMSNAIDEVVEKVNAGMESITGALTGALETLQGIGDVASSLEIPGFKMPTASIQIPHLATGAVIPPNKQFLAMLGDQKSGTNIEAPLDTIKQAVAETLSGMNFNNEDQGDIVLQIDGYEVFRAIRNQNDKFRNSTGYGAL